jgi:hypothetical protein
MPSWYMFPKTIPTRLWSISPSSPPWALLNQTYIRCLSQWRQHTVTRYNSVNTLPNKTTFLITTGTSLLLPPPPPIAMDTDLPTRRNLWVEIAQLPGIHRCDPCRRTHDLGKWNIYSKKASHHDICAWLDENLVNCWSQLPGKDIFPVITPFLIPERLSKGRQASSANSVASGLTNASPVHGYFRTLERNLPIRNLPEQPSRNVSSRILPMLLPLRTSLPSMTNHPSPRITPPSPMRTSLHLPIPPHSTPS